MGVQPGLRAFIAAVIGGIGNLPGAALGGLLLGLVETFAGGIPAISNYRDGIAFAILILILLFKPSGLLGKSQTEKV
jgi:branched-chain amino acid transport system permease protein